MTPLRFRHMTTEWWWLEGSPPSRHDPREDDPDWYRDAGGSWIKRSKWTWDNAPNPLEDGRSYLRYVSETAAAQRREHRDERMRRQGLVRWKDLWVTSERAKELDQQELEAMNRRFDQQRQLEEMRSRAPSWWPWC